MKYYQCNKCGTLGWSENGEAFMCAAPMHFRTSGICGGSYDEITKDEFDKLNQKP